MQTCFDTIAAPITAIGGAVAMARLSGPESFSIALRLLKTEVKPEPKRAYYVRYKHGDDGLAVFFEEGYTGEKCVELSIHGSAASMRGLMEACAREGARPARPGEFTERAFLNGRLDLSSAEAVKDAVEAQTEAQLRYAQANLQGSLRQEVTELREKAISFLAAVEADADFSEEVGAFDEAGAIQTLESLCTRVEKLIESAEIGRVLKNGIRVAIVGPPNAGKSSLFNAILGLDRAIVTPHAGTTRDTVEETIDAYGVPLVLVDTAGLRETEDHVESIGIERSKKAIESADRIWYVYDGSEPFANLDEIPENAKLLANKSDLGPIQGPGSPISAVTKQGVELLLKEIADSVLGHERPMLANERQGDVFREVLQSLRVGIETISQEMPYDLLAVTLHEAIHALGAVTGETAAPDMVERIFSEFCIGK